MKILIACEESQAVTIAFRNNGHEAYSCDTQQCSGGHPEYHLQIDVRKIWKATRLDFLGAHNPCTFLANSGVRWLVSEKERPGFIYSKKIGKFYNPERWKLMEEAADFFLKTYYQIIRIGKGYIENPIMHKYAMAIINVKPTQIIQPYHFGHGEKKATCLWLVGLPLLKPTQIVEGREQRIWKMAPSPDRQKLRSKTFPGIAQAMADQWNF